MPEQWERNPERVWIAKLTADNAERVAAWCGGKVERTSKASDPDDVAVWVHVPTIGGIVRAFAGKDWVIKDDATGRFRVVKADAVREGYHRVDG